MYLKINSNSINNITNIPDSITSLNIEYNSLGQTEFEKINAINSLSKLYLTGSGITNISGLKNNLSEFRDRDYPIIDKTVDNSILINTLKSISELELSSKYDLMLIGTTVELSGSETEDEVSVLMGQTRNKIFEFK